MKIAIKTEVFPATEFKCKRIKATAMQDIQSGMSVFHDFDSSISDEKNHLKALRKLIEKLGWYGDYYGGTTAKGYVFVCIRPPKDSSQIHIFRIEDESKTVCNSCNGNSNDRSAVCH